MAWVFKNAEHFLNNLDQTATGALGTSTPQKAPTGSEQREGYSHSSNQSPSIPSSQSSYSLSATELAQTANIRRTPSDTSISTGAPKGKGQGSSGRLRTEADDEKLFEFLNSPSPTGGEGRRKKSAPAKVGHSRQSSTASTISSRSAKAENPVGTTPPVTPPATEEPVDGDDQDEADLGDMEDGNSPALSESSEPMEPPSSQVTRETGPEGSRVLGSEVMVPGDSHQQLSSLQLENKLLKNEVTSLNEEMVAALGRVKKAQEETKRLNGELRKRESQASSTDNMVRQLQGREEDLMEELNAKNSQLAVLRVRLQEADQDIKAKARQLNDLDSERDRILRDHSDSSGIHSQALDSQKVKLQEAEEAVNREKESYKSLQAESMERQAKLEAEQKNLADAVTTAQQRFNDEKAHSSALSQQLQSAKHNMEEAKNELADYKQKAARILSSKEKLITSLKAGTTNSEGETQSVEHTELLHERDMLKEEIQQANAKIEQLRQEVQDLEALQQSETESSQDHMRDLEDQLAQQRQQLQDMEGDLAKKSEQLRYAEDENYKQKMSLTGKMKERDEEIQRLRNQLVAKTAGSSSQAELENRLRTLTESLIQKQTMLEALGTEKNSLTLQLERAERVQREQLQSQGQSHGHTAVPIGNTDDDEGSSISTRTPRSTYVVSPCYRSPSTALSYINPRLHVRACAPQLWNALLLDIRKARTLQTFKGARQRGLPTFMRELPSDASVTRNVKRAANTLDKLSIRIGVTLRRYPIARLFVIAYMISLHLWVTVVLLTYSPEMHGMDYHPKES